MRKMYLAIWSSFKFALYLIDNGRGGVLARNLHRFSDMSHNVFAKRLFARDNFGAVFRNLGNFKYLDYEVAKKLIDNMSGRFIPESISSFVNQSHPQIAVSLILNGLAHLVNNKIGNFVGLEEWNYTETIKIESDRNISALRYPNPNYTSNNPGVEKEHHIVAIIEIEDGHQQFFGEQEQVLLEVTAYLEGPAALASRSSTISR